jgi:hypothetical protein
MSNAFIRIQVPLMLYCHLDVSTKSLWTAHAARFLRMAVAAVRSMSERFSALAEAAIAQAEVHSLLQPPADDPILADAPAADASQNVDSSSDGQLAPTGSERKDAAESVARAHTV